MLAAVGLALSLVGLLLAKKVITEDEYEEEVRLLMKREDARED